MVVYSTQGRGGSEAGRQARLSGSRSGRDVFCMMMQFVVIRVVVEVDRKVSFSGGTCQ